jgi:hypothetical protein
MNAAVWLGSAVFFTFSAAPAFFSTDMKQVLGTANYPYFSGAIAQIVLARYFAVSLTCAVIATVHLLLEWLYMGRPARKFSLALVGGLLVFTLIGGNWLQPKMKKLHAVRYAVNVPPDERATAAKSFRTWHAVAQILNVFMMGALVVYVWRVANPSDTLRFVRPVTFRG